MLRPARTPLLSLALMAALSVGAIVPVRTALADAVSEDEQVSLLFKVLSLDRRVAASGDYYAMAVLHDSRSEPSTRQYETLMELLRGRRAVLDRPIVLHHFDFAEEGASLADFLSKHRIALVWVTRDLGRFVPRVIARTRAAGVTSVAADVHHVEQGLSVGFERLDGKSRVVINLAAARAEHCDFAASLLKISRLIQPSSTEGASPAQEATGAAPAP